MRLIDADALMKELEMEVELADDWKTAHEIANVVKYFPTIEPEQKTGKWLELDFTEAWECDQCGRLSDFKENYCPSCGADMRGEEDD